MTRITRFMGLGTLMASLAVFVPGCHTDKERHHTKFEWDATESAPLHYPMEIIQGTFIYRGEAEAGLYIPSGGTISSGWGHPISSHVTDEKYKPLPDRLKIAFFSLAEKQFYQGEFALPYERILELFRDGIANPRVFPNGATMPNYSRIMVGVAPGGVVAVWAAGPKKTEVFFGQAQKVDLDPGAAFALPFKDDADADSYMQEILEADLTPAELASLKKHGIPFGLWARYRQRYDWLPVFHGGHNPDYIRIAYLNGDYNSYRLLADKQELTAPRPVPRKASFAAPSTGGEIFELEFDEFETMAAFEKLGANGKKVYMEFEPRMPKTQIKIRLYNDTESIVLKKFESKP